MPARPFGTPTHIHELQLFSSGQTWNHAQSLVNVFPRGSVTHGIIGARVTLSGGGEVSSLALVKGHDTTDKFALFKFTQGSQTDYGWIELSMTLEPSSPTGPDMTITNYAYDCSGAVIKAGDLGTGPSTCAQASDFTPEPASFDLTGLAALALGAASVRRWRKAKGQSVAE